MTTADQLFHPLNICVLTVSDSRTQQTDSSGRYLATVLQDEGHILYERALVVDSIYDIRAQTSIWIANPKVQVILITGGTGFAGRDSTPEAITPLLDKHIVGFGELFRQLSFGEIASSTIQSRALAGLANRTLLFCLPGSTGACTTGWTQIIRAQLDSRTRPCNFYSQIHL